MKILSTKTHGILDYTVSLIIMSAPWLLGFAAGGNESLIPVLVGGTGIAYSVFTNYEFGIMKVIPMKTHLLLDVVSGILLALSPWIFGFSERVYVPHLVLGIFEIGAALATDPIVRTPPARDPTER